MATLRPLLAAALVAAALIVVASARPRVAFACSYAPGFDVAANTESASLILVGRVTDVREEDTVRLDPEVYLKGPAEAELQLKWYGTTCPLAELDAGERVLVFIYQDDEARWPQDYNTIRLHDGFAEHEWNGFARMPEAELINDIRAITGQYAVPAATETEGAGIDWGKTVIPVTAIVLAVFGVGLVLMRIWHRIDPS